MLTRIYHKKDEHFNIEFFQDKECRQAFNFENVKNLYIELKEGDITPLSYIFYSNFTGTVFVSYFNDSSSIENFSLIRHMGCNTNIKFITIENDIFQAIIENCKNVNLVNLSFNLSKYIPTDNAILFLNEDDADKYSDKCEAWFLYQENLTPRELNSQMDIRDYKKITIFIESYTESEIKKTIDIAKKLKEKYGIEEVNVFALHCFANLDGGDDYINAFIDKGNGSAVYLFFEEFINKIITTNSTGTCETQNKKRLQVIDCYDIFNNYLKGE